MADFPYVPSWAWQAVVPPLSDLLGIDRERIKTYTLGATARTTRVTHIFVQGTTVSDRKIVVAWAEDKLDKSRSLWNWKLWWDEADFRKATSWPKN